jgi:hypothetical protein
MIHLHFLRRFQGRIEERHEIFRPQYRDSHWNFESGFLLKKLFQIFEKEIYKILTSKQGKSLRALFGRMCVAK